MAKPKQDSESWTMRAPERAVSLRRGADTLQKSPASGVDCDRCNYLYAELSQRATELNRMLTALLQKLNADR
jgi:hypothetical protein